MTNSFFYFDSPVLFYIEATIYMFHNLKSINNSVLVEQNSIKQNSNIFSTLNNILWLMIEPNNQRVWKNKILFIPLIINYYVK